MSNNLYVTCLGFAAASEYQDKLFGENDHIRQDQLAVEAGLERSR